MQQAGRSLGKPYLKCGRLSFSTAAQNRPLLAAQPPVASVMSAKVTVKDVRSGWKACSLLLDESMHLSRCLNFVLPIPTLLGPMRQNLCPSVHFWHNMGSI